MLKANIHGILGPLSPICCTVLSLGAHVIYMSTTTAMTCVSLGNTDTPSDSVTGNSPMTSNSYCHSQSQEPLPPLRMRKVRFRLNN